MKRLIAIAAWSAVVALTGSAHAASVSYTCRNVADAKDIVGLTVKSAGAWRIETGKHYYQGSAATGKRRGRYVYFEGPDSDVSRGDGADDVLIENSLLNDSATWRSQNVIGNVKIRWTDENDRDHTDTYSCPAD